VKIAKTAALVAAIVLVAPAAREAYAYSDVTKSLSNVPPEQADRLYAAMLQPSSTKDKSNGVEVVVGWTVTGNEKNANGWFIRGQLKNGYHVDGANTGGPINWVKSLFRPSNEIVDFECERGVLIEYSAASKLLQVSLQESPERIGKYNIMVTGNAGTNAKLSFPTVSAASPNFSVSAAGDQKKYSVGVTGLPYILYPHLNLDAWGATGRLRLRMGIGWESRAQISAEPVQGTAHSVNFAMSYEGLATVKAESGTTNEPFNSTVHAQSVGAGLLGIVRYDETNTDCAYQLSMSADQSWFIQVAGYPVTQLGSAHWEKAVNVASQGPLPVPAIDGKTIAAPASAPTVQASETQWQASASKLQQYYGGIPGTVVLPPPAPPTGGFVQTLGGAADTSASAKDDSEPAKKPAKPAKPATAKPTRSSTKKTKPSG
jgi:hypothetical protein